MTEDQSIAQDAYDALADSYADEIASNPYNEHMAFPGTTGLVPDVEDKRILDAGCGTGKYTKWLLDQGADVVGIDVSEAMLERAIESIGDAARFHRASLDEPLSFASEDEFDGIVSGLALGYVKDWGELFSEFGRILKPNGFVVFSVKHPVNEFPLDEDENYYEIERTVKEWAVDVPYFSRPLEAMFNPIMDAGFSIDAIDEPQPTDAFEEEWPERYAKESRHPVFLVIRAVNETNRSGSARTFTA
ncbi:MAG: class I SAM-dependent methyltransferase [Halobacteriaceae archaeon]